MILHEGSTRNCKQSLEILVYVDLIVSQLLLQICESPNAPHPKGALLDWDTGGCVKKYLPPL